MSTLHCSALPADAQTITCRATRPWPLRLIDRVREANTRHRQHQALLHLDDALLRDIGLTRFDAESEAKRSVWDAPTHWRG